MKGDVFFTVSSVTLTDRIDGDETYKAIQPMMVNLNATIYMNQGNFQPTYNIAMLMWTTQIVTTKKANESMSAASTGIYKANRGGRTREGDAKKGKNIVIERANTYCDSLINIVAIWICT